MILILRDNNSSISGKLENSLEKLGKKALILCQSDIANAVSVTFDMTQRKDSFKLSYRLVEVLSEEIEGVLVEFDQFTPDHWIYMSEKDSKYAATEMTALWYSMLSSLKCPVINPPGSNLLSGTIPTISELYYKAKSYNIKVPAYSIIETGIIASQLVDKGVLASFVDLGQNPYLEMKLSSELLNRYPTYFNHVRVRELTGNVLVSIAVVGDKIFPTLAKDIKERRKMNYSEIPKEYMDSLLKIHSFWNLIVAEYYFTVDIEGTWYLNSMITNVSNDSLHAHGSDIINALVNCIIGEGK